MNDGFWTHDIHLFDGTFRYFRNRKQPVRGKVHVASEKYFDVYGSLERDYLHTTKGERSYVMMQPYVIEPRIVLSAALHPKPRQYADQSEEIGQSMGSRTEGYRDVQVGSAQAWYV